MENTDNMNTPRSLRANITELLSQLPALQTGLTVTINTRDAALYWENSRMRWRLTALSRLWQAQKNDNPWADALLWQLEQSMAHSRAILERVQKTMDDLLAALPPGIVVSTPDWSEGVSLGQQSACPPVGYCITLFALFNQALLTLLQVRMTGLEERHVMEKWRGEIYQAMNAPVQLLMPGAQLRAGHSTTRRADLLQFTPLARQWLNQAGMPATDVLTGKTRSRWQSPLNLPGQMIAAIQSLPPDGLPVPTNEVAPLEEEGEETNAGIADFVDADNITIDGGE